MDELCAAPEPGQEAVCATCDSEGRVFGKQCPDPLSTLVQLCDGAHAACMFVGCLGGRLSAPSASTLSVYLVQLCDACCIWILLCVGWGTPVASLHPPPTHPPTSSPLHAVPEVPEQCGNLTAMCATPDVAKVYTEVCIGANAYTGDAAAAPSPLAAPAAAAGAGAAVSVIALLLAAALQALLV